MQRALIGIDPKSRRCRIVGLNSDDTMFDILEYGLIAVPTSTRMARTLFDEVVTDVFAVANQQEEEHAGT